MKANNLLFVLLISLFILACTPKTTQVIQSTTEVLEEKVEEVTMKSSPIPDLPLHERLVHGTLSNGMKYYILKNQKPENRAELRLAVNAGAMQEDENQRGLAHFVEHMAFNGTKNFKKNELVSYLESTGARFGPDLNAYTSFDETVYMLQVRTDVDSLYKKGLLVIEDWAGSISFDDDEIDKERGVVESEWRTRLSPNQRMQQEYFPKMYYGSRYAERLPIGEPEIINNADYLLFKKFYKDWYRPELMAVIVVGDVDVEKTKKMIEANFSSIKSDTQPREKLSNVVPKHKETIVSIVTDQEAPFTQVRIMYKHDREPMENIDDYRQTLVRRLYNQMLNTRLQELTEKADPPFIYAYSGYSRDVGDLAVYRSFTSVPEDKIMEGFESVLRENQRVLLHGFNQSELDRQKLELLERYKRSALESDKTQSRRYASQLVYRYLDGNPFLSEGQSLTLVEDFLPQIFLADVNRLAKQWMTKENRVVVVTAPDKKDVLIPTEEEILLKFEEIENETIEPYVDKVISEPLFSKDLTDGDIISEKIYEVNNIHEFVLSNGAKVVLKKTDFQNDQILLNANSPGGHCKYTGDDYINADYAASIVNESGLANFSNSDLERLLTGKKVSVYPYIADYSEGVSGSCSPKDAETMFQLVHLYFTEPRRDEEAFTSFINKQKGFFQNILSNPDYYFMDFSSKLKTNSHERSGFPDSKKMDKVKLDRVMELYKERFSDASDFTFTFVGNIDEESFKSLIKKYIATLPAVDREDKILDTGKQYLKGNIEKNISKGKAEKTQVELFYHGKIEHTPQKAYQFKSMIDILKIKMRESMREDKGGVYGVRVSGYMSRIPKEEYSITISFNCDPGREQELIETAIKDIEYAKQHGASETDLQKIKETQIQSLTKNIKENKYWSQKISDSYRFGTNPDDIGLPGLKQFVNELTSDDIKASAGSFFGKNKIQLIMKPAEKESN